MQTALKELVEKQKYKEALLKPKLDDSLDKLLNKYDSIMTEYHFRDENQMFTFIQKALDEKNNILILKEYCGHWVIVWKG